MATTRPVTGTEHVVLNEAEVEKVEDETAEEAVLGVGDKIQDLSWRSGEVIITKF